MRKRKPTQFKLETDLNKAGEPIDLKKNNEEHQKLIVKCAAFIKSRETGERWIPKK